MALEATPPEMTVILIGAAIALAAILILLLTRKHCTVRPRPCSGLGQGSSAVLGLFLLIDRGRADGELWPVRGGPYAVVECHLPGIASMLATISSSTVARPLESSMAG
jgi:hypothetical protein